MKKLLVALSFLLAPAAFAGPYTLTVHNYTNKTFHWHQDAGVIQKFEMFDKVGYELAQAIDFVAPPATVEFQVPSVTQLVAPASVQTTQPCIASNDPLSCTSYGPPQKSTVYDTPAMNDPDDNILLPASTQSGFYNKVSSLEHTPEGLRVSYSPLVNNNINIYIYPSIIEEQQRNTEVLNALNKTINSKLDALNTTIDSTVKNEVQNTNVVQTSVNNYLTTTSGTQTNLVNAVSTAMQTARETAALDTKDYGVNNFYPSMTKQSSDGKYLVYPAQSFTLSGGCVLNAAPNNYLTVLQDASQEKNTTQLLTAMMLGRRVEITQHQKDAETTDCGVIDSVKILDK